MLPSVAKKNWKKVLREVFSKFFGHAGAHMHKTKNRGHRDLSVVKFSAWCDAWSSKKRKNTKIAETIKISVKIDKNPGFRQVLEDLGLIRIHSDVPHDFLLQIHLKSTLYDLWALCYDKKFVQKSCPTTKTFSLFFCHRR